jgi:hypothetical protein
MNASQERIGSLKCQPDVLGKVLGAFRAALQREAQAAQIEVHDASEVVKEGRLEGFGFKYTAGAVRARVDVEAQRHAGAAEASYQLKVRIEEQSP